MRCRFSICGYVLDYLLRCYDRHYCGVRDLGICFAGRKTERGLHWIGYTAYLGICLPTI